MVWKKILFIHLFYFIVLMELGGFGENRERKKEKEMGSGWDRKESFPVDHFKIRTVLLICK